jgi:probable nitrogen fixation protein
MSFKDILVSKLRSYDNYGVWKKVSDEDLLKRNFVLTLEQKKKIDVFATMPQETIGRIRLFYEAVAQAVEAESKEIIITVVDINSEGFGRILLLEGDRVIFLKVIRNAHKFGFKDIEKMIEEGDKTVSSSLAKSP